MKNERLKKNTHTQKTTKTLCISTSYLNYCNTKGEGEKKKKELAALI